MSEPICFGCREPIAAGHNVRLCMDIASELEAYEPIAEGAGGAAAAELTHRPVRPGTIIKGGPRCQ